MTDNRGLTWLLGLASIIIILTGLKAAESITIPIMLALFIAIISMPFLRMMTMRGVPSVVAVLIVLLVIIVFGGLLLMVVRESIDSFIQQLPHYQTRLQTILAGTISLLERFNIPLTREIVMQHVDPATLMSWLGMGLSAMSSLLSNVLLVFFIVVFILLENTTFPKKMKIAMPNGISALNGADGFMARVNKYLLIKTTISIVTGFFITILLFLIGVDFPVLWGLMATLMNFIPLIGSLIAAVPAVLLALVQLGFADALLVTLGYVVINLVIGNFIEPKYMGRGLGLSPLVVFLSLLIWGWLFGPVGMFLSIPLTMIVKIALEPYEETRWIAVMLSSDVSGPLSEPPLQTIAESEVSSKVADAP